MESVVAMNVRRIIEEKGLKLCHVAKIAGYSKNAFYAMLSNRKYIKDYDIPRIARALKVTPNELFHENHNVSE